MLQNIRDNSQGWIAKTIIGIIVALMALTGFDAIMTSTSTAQTAAEVNGEEISQSALAQAADAQRRQLMQQLGKDFDSSLLDEKLLREAALKGLIDRQLLLQGAQSAKFAFSEAALDQLILQTPEFQVEGKFSAARYDQVLQQMGYTRLQFRQMLQQEMLIGQLRAAFAGSGFVTDAEVQAFAKLEKQTRDFAALTIKADPAKVKIAEADIQAYFDEHAAEYKSAEQVVLEYLELKKDAFFSQVEVKDDDLKALYEKEIAALAEQRQAAHILIEVSDKLNEEQAKAKIEEIAKRVGAGEDFAALAKELSNDPSSAENGGDLGYAGPGVYDPAFEKSLYELKLNQVSAPVRSEFGWHLIKLLGVQAPDVPSFTSLKDKLARDFKSQEVEKLFVEASKQLESLAYESSDLAQPAQELDLKVQLSAAFGREGGDGLAANRQVLQAAFSKEVLEDGANSGLIELDPETVVVVRVKEHKMPEPLKLEQVSETIRGHLLSQRAAEQAKLDGEALIADLRSGKTPTKAAKADTWKVQEAATRNQEGVEPAVLQAVFRMAKPQAADKPAFAGVELGNGDFVVVRLNGVSEQESALSDEEKTMYRRFLASRSGQQDFNAFRRQLQAKAEIERF